MKIPLSIRRDYDEQLDKIIRLQKFVDDSIRAAKKPNWHYESRIKSKESFALKIETGRFPDPKELEDFFACMLVVENSKSLVEAEDMIKSKFDFIRTKSIKIHTELALHRSRIRMSYGYYISA